MFRLRHDAEHQEDEGYAEGSKDRQEDLLLLRSLRHEQEGQAPGGKEGEDPGLDRGLPRQDVLYWREAGWRRVLPARLSWARQRGKHGYHSRSDHRCGDWGAGTG